MTSSPPCQKRSERSLIFPMEFELHPHPAPVSADERAQILKDPGFGSYFTDHMATIEWKADVSAQREAAAAGNFLDMKGTWSSARIEPFGPITLSPAAGVLHYAQEVFEGIKAYRHQDGSIWTFRPFENARRLNRSARRLALPQLDEEAFVKAIQLLVEQDQDWVPDGDGQSLYIRPFMIGTEAFLGVRPARAVSFHVIASPAGNYFGGELKPVSIMVSRQYARSGPGGTGEAKCGGNYAASLAPQLEADAQGYNQVLFLDPTHDNAVEELGGMNVMFVTDDNRLITPQLTGTILEGVTRKSILQLAEDQGMTVEERRITLDEWDRGVAEGTITEVFACGTAAVITPIGTLRDGDRVIDSSHSDFAVTNRLRQTLLDLQTGASDDPYGWLYRLA